MPNRRKSRWESRQPTMIDVNNVITEIGYQFGYTVRFEIEVRNSMVSVIGRCLDWREQLDGEVTYQALHKVSEKSTVPMEQRLFGVAYDLYAQCEAGDPSRATKRPRSANELGRWIVVPAD